MARAIVLVTWIGCALVCALSIGFMLWRKDAATVGYSIALTLVIVLNLFLWAVGEWWSLMVGPFTGETAIFVPVPVSTVVTILAPVVRRARGGPSR